MCVLPRRPAITTVRIDHDDDESGPRRGDRSAVSIASGESKNDSKKKRKEKKRKETEMEGKTKRTGPPTLRASKKKK